ncbi:MAG: PKD domain-containing protein [Nitrospirae bacterium]|nr:PKD domain-containing protein [Nitrospirota bacterium]
MVRYTKFVGDMKVMLELFAFDSSGHGIIGLTPVLAVRRLVDNKYLDFHDNIFKSSTWISRTTGMTEVDQVNLSGCYSYEWNSKPSVLVSGEFCIEYNAVGYGTDKDYVEFKKNTDETSKKILYNKREIDKTAPDFREVLFDDDGVSEIAKWRHVHSAEEDSRTPLDIPKANFRSSQEIGFYAVDFTDLSTENPSGWDWDFGDGGYHSSSQNPTHEYASAGEYSVTLTAINEYGISSVTFVIVVE